MVKKLPIRFRIKPVIDSLREGAKTWSELQKLMPDTEIPSEYRTLRTGTTATVLDRILTDYLLYFGLVKQENGKYYWYENLRYFDSEEEKKDALEHSKLLVPAIEQFLELLDTDHPLFNDFNQHLRTGYPEIHQKLEELLDMMNEKNKELLRKYAKEITDLRSGYANYEHQPFQLLQFLLVWRPKPEHQEIKNNMLLALKSLLEAYRNLSEELTLIKHQIEHGTALKGSCELCPKDRIKKQKTG